MTDRTGRAVESIEQVLTLISENSGLEREPVALGLLLLAGLTLHFALAMLLRRARRLAEASDNRWDEVVLAALEGPLRLVLWVVVFYLALEVYPLTGGVQQFMGRAYGTAMVLLLAWFLHRLIKGVEAGFLARDSGSIGSRDKATIHATAKLLRITMWAVAGLMVLQSVGVTVSGLLAFGGIGGIAVGFAAKDLLANFFGGLSIYLDRPFTTGDWIRSPDKTIEGTVEDIGWRLTRIRTFDQRPLYVPNAVFSQISVENPSRMFNRRIYETVGIRYQDADKMESIVERVREMLQNHPEIDLTRTLIVNFVSFGTSSLDFFVYTFTKTTDWVTFHGVKQDVLLKILAIVHDCGADVAFPTQSLQVQQVSPEPQP